MKKYRMTMTVTNDEGKQETHVNDFFAAGMSKALDIHCGILKEVTRDGYSVLKCSLEKL